MQARFTFNFNHLLSVPVLTSSGTFPDCNILDAVTAGRIKRLGNVNSLTKKIQ